MKLGILYYINIKGFCPLYHLPIGAEIYWYNGFKPVENSPVCSDDYGRIDWIGKLKKRGKNET